MYGPTRMDFSKSVIKISQKEYADLVTFTEEILNGKLLILCSVKKCLFDFLNPWLTIFSYLSFLFNYQINKIFVYRVFNKWNKLNGINHFPKSCQHCLKFSSRYEWSCLLIKNHLPKKIIKRYMYGPIKVFYKQPQITRRLLSILNFLLVGLI